MQLSYLIIIYLFVFSIPTINLSGQDKPKGITLFVSKDGSDAFSGKSPEVNQNKTDGPFATLEKARDTVRKLKKEPLSGTMTVCIRGGTYQLSKTFELFKKDSGTKDAPIVYRPYNNEKVRLVGGIEITGFKPIDDPSILKRIEEQHRDKILQVNLKAQGIKDFGEMTPRGMGRPMYPAGLELFFQDKPMQLARWPNNEWARIADAPKGKQGRFIYEGDRPERWMYTDDIWLHGYWTWDWADSHEKIKKIDLEKKEFVTYEPHGVYGYSKGKRYYAQNILEELDEPGEWYLDRKAGILYFWPPAPIDEGETYVSILDKLIKMTDASYVTLQGMEIGICRGTAIEMLDCKHSTIAGCVLRNIGNVAVNIDGGTENGVVSCDIYNCGDGGVILKGGDRQWLTPAGNYVHNTHIHDYNRWDYTYHPAIKIEGVGNRISNNLINNAPHSAIMLKGNEHIIEYNEIHHVCMETHDAGAFYMGRDYSERGNIIRYNFIHDIVNSGAGDVQAIHFDDFASGTTVFGNVIYKAKRGVLIGGGRDNMVQNNIFADCSIAAVHIDARGLNWAKKYFDGTDTTLTDRLRAVKYKFPPYTAKYPELLTLYDDNPAIPEGNKIVCNIVSGGKWLNLNEVDNKIVVIQDNLVEKDPCFIDPQKMNFQLSDDSPAYKLGFQHIPMEKIGLYKDEFRLSLHAN